eukprot:TRINITY_DN1276_c0_g1_i6.p1 TRINITY_DN1276_c0_g1~~TRINITY_DN1276_c0_g1_i6.p1  ORF type:complete len:293 (+),score=54.96 TRINITY_DN1276_c0_g1_i6:246-1124(+)
MRSGRVRSGSVSSCASLSGHQYLRFATIVFLILCDIHLVCNTGRCGNESCLCERQKHGFEYPIWQIPDQTQVTGNVFTSCTIFAMDTGDESEKVEMEMDQDQVDELQSIDRDSKEIPKKKIVSVPPVVSVEKKRTALDGEEKEASPKTRPVLMKAVSADIGDQANYEFYTDRIPSQPEGAKISVIHEQWSKNYELLESHHGFIQWLFPLHEDNGVNHFARKLTKWEASQMIEDETIARRILTSYKMMLGFYGMKLKDEVTGEIVRATDFKTRYRNLLSNPHNNLRISILPNY